jgi:hypothetical protein
MPALPPYMPAQQAAFTSWLNNFSTLISEGPSAYGLLPSDAATIAALNATWSAAIAPIDSPATKTAQAVAAKDTARVVVSAQARTYAQSIANNPGVSVDNKIALGLNPKTSTPSPISPPSTFPVLALQAQTPLQVTLRYRDSAASVSVKAKPFGATACQIYGMASATPVTLRSTLPMIAMPTKSPFVLDLPEASVGQQFYVAARWAIQTGQLGPWSQILSFTVTG